MKLVVDSNFVFSAMLNPESNAGDIILNSQDSFTFYSCEYLLTEISEHKDKIILTSGYTESEYDQMRHLIFKRINLVQERLVPFEFWTKAADFVRDIDMNDIAFVAMSLFLDAKLWTGDKVLSSGLARKGFTNVISTQKITEFRLGY
ncbi:MAG: PIN domain-containing protein [Bacteroidota bacterium]